MLARKRAKELLRARWIADWRERRLDSVHALRGRLRMAGLAVAELLSKAILLARDGEIKDPTILVQVLGRR